MSDRPEYDGPENLGQLWELSEDAQKIWEAYQELSAYVDNLETVKDDILDAHEREDCLRDLVSEIENIISDTDDKTAEELGTEIQSALDSSWASW